MGSVVRIALFDLDNTLVDRSAAFRRWAQAFAEERQLGAQAVEWLCAADGDGSATRDQLFAAARRQFSLSDSVGTLVGRYRVEYACQYTPVRPVVDRLAYLRRLGWRIGIVTNGPASQAEKIERSGLRPLVDAYCISEECGWEKPDSRLFAEAVQRCARGAEVSEAWMTGDDPFTDMGGARRAGLRTIWLDRGRTWADADWSPDAVVQSVQQAVSVLVRSPESATPR